MIPTPSPKTARSAWGRSISALCFAAAVIAPGLRIVAQDVAFVCDSANDAVYRMVDLDLDGTIDPATEVQIYYDDSSPGLDLSTPSHLHPYGDALLLADGGTLDALLLLRDLNGDGDANDAGEMTPFFDDSSPELDLSTPNGIAIDAFGSVFVCDDGSGAKRVVRLQDLDGDDDALDPGELQLFFDGSAVEAGPTEDPESIAVGSDGTVYVGDSTLGQVFALVDLNGDGDALDALESRLFYDGNPFPVGDVDAITVGDDGTVYVVNEDDGTILALFDADGNGAAEAGEATEFLSGSVITDANDALWIGGGELLVADGANDAVYRVADLDGNGNANDPGEVTPFFDDGSALLATPSGVTFFPAAAPPPAPVLTAISATTGSIAGGLSIELSGSALSGVTDVLFGSTPVTGFTLVRGGTIQVTTPEVATGGVFDVTVSGPGGSATLFGGFVYQRPFLRGDVDGNGSLQVTDGIATILAILGQPASTCPAALDVNDDDALEISDAVFLLNYLFAFGPEPTAPFPAVGIEPSPGALICD